MRRTLGVLLAALATPLVLGVVLSVLLWLKLGLSLDARELGVVALNGLFAVDSLPVSLLVAAALVLLSASIGCSTRNETRVTDWCIRRETVGWTVGPWSGNSSSECLVRRWGLWRRLDELAVGPVLALDPDTVLLSVPGRRKLIRRGERRARPVCDDNEYGVLPPGHDAIDCLGFVAGPAMGVPTSVRFRRLDIQGRPAGVATILDADRDAAPRGSVAIPGAGPSRPSGGDGPATAVTGARPRRVFAALAIAYYDDARAPYFMTYDDSNPGHPDCALLELSGAGLRVHAAAPGAKLRECSDRKAWSRVVGRTLHAPE